MKSALKKLIKNISNKNDKSNDQIYANNILKNNGVRRLTIALIGALTPIFITIIVVIVVVLGPIIMAKQYMEDLKNDVSIFFDKVGNVLTLRGWCSDKDGSCEKKSEQKYYERLDKVVQQYKKKNVTIDAELITATMFYGNTMSDDKFNSEDDNEEKDESAIEKIKDLIDGDDIHLGDISVLASNMVSNNRLDYTKYKEYLSDTYIEKRFNKMYSDDEEKQKIIKEIMAFASLEPDSISPTDSYYGSCSYNVSGSTVDTTNTQVVVLTCDGSRELERIDLEKYIKGVVYGEIGNTWPDEVLKSQAIAARSFTLTRNEMMCPGNPLNCNYGYNSKTNEIRMRDCEADQVYCDYENGCQRYLFNGFVSLVSGINNPSLKVYKPPLQGQDKERFENALKEVEGLVLMKSDNTIYQTPFVSTVQTTWKNMYDNNNNFKYDDILLGYYGQKSNAQLVIGGNCSVASGDFEKWQQSDEKWGSKSYGNTTLAAVGCNFTSIVIEIAFSGLPTTIDNFNPGTAFDYMKSKGYLGPNGDTRSYAAFSEMAPDFNYAGLIDVRGYSDLQVRQKLIELLDSKNYPIIHVQSGNSLPYYTNNHWVAVIGYTKDDVIIVDPAKTGCTRLFTCKPGLDRSNGYGITTQIAYWN